MEVAASAGRRCGVGIVACMYRTQIMMDTKRNAGPEAIVASRRLGTNGIPEPSALDTDLDELSAADGDSGTDTRADFAAAEGGEASPASYLPWIALGAIVIGTAGALLGARGRRRRQPSWMAIEDVGDLTPPHGDRLLPRT